MKHIDSVDKVIKSFKKSYEILCEFSHPNMAGVSRSYMKTHTDESKLYFSYDINKVPISIGLDPFIGTLGHFKNYYNMISKIYEDFIDLTNGKPTTASNSV